MSKFPIKCDPELVKKSDYHKFKRIRKYFELLIGTDFGAKILMEDEGVEKLWKHAKIAEEKETLELTMVFERYEESIDDYLGPYATKYPERDVRYASKAKADWNVGEFLLWRRFHK